MPKGIYERPPLSDRFWSKVDTSGDCWIWIGSTVASGYGSFCINGVTIVAHRVAFYLTYDRWPEPFCLHSCDNRLCVNPAHLHEGTKADNNRECRERGRARRAVGEKVAGAKLTDADVLVIRSTGVRSKELAIIFQVSEATISLVRHGKMWKHLL